MVWITCLLAYMFGAGFEMAFWNWKIGEGSPLFVIVCRVFSSFVWCGRDGG